MSFLFLGWLRDHHAFMAMLQANETKGLILVALVIFCETGLVVLPFLPGDLILFSLGAFVGIAGHSPLLPLASMAMAAIAGDGVNFLIGRSRVGQSLADRGWISEKNMARTKFYFDRYGAATVTIGRFVPVVRTIAPFMAGISHMDPRRFFLFNVLGGVLWTSLMVLGGYFLGRIEWVTEHLSMLSGFIVAISVLPILTQWLRRKRQAT